MQSVDKKALEREIALLTRCEFHFGIKTAPVVIQLAAYAEQSLPDVLPDRPAWQVFNWPANGDVDLRGYWREHDRGRPYFGGFGA